MWPSFVAGMCLSGSVVSLTLEFGERRTFRGLVDPPFSSAMSPSLWAAPTPCLYLTVSVVGLAWFVGL